jgi:hypothetical protein
LHNQQSSRHNLTGTDLQMIGGASALKLLIEQFLRLRTGQWCSNVTPE